MSKRILFLTPQLPYPLYQGTAIRNFGLIDGLAKRGHRITLLSFVEANQPRAAKTPLADLCEEVLVSPVPERTSTRRLVDLARGRRLDHVQHAEDHELPADQPRTIAPAPCTSASR